MICFLCTRHSAIIKLFLRRTLVLLVLTVLLDPHLVSLFFLKGYQPSICISDLMKISYPVSNIIFVPSSGQAMAIGCIARLSPRLRCDVLLKRGFDSTTVQLSHCSGTTTCNRVDAGKPRIIFNSLQASFCFPTTFFFLFSNFAETITVDMRLFILSQLHFG